MELAHPLFSLQSSLPRTSLLSPLLAIPATRRRRALDEAELLLEDGVNGEAAQTLEADEANSRELEGEVDNKDMAMTTGAGAEVHGVEDDLAGRTTTNHNETVMHLLISSPTGRCWRRSISTVWLN